MFTIIVFIFLRYLRPVETLFYSLHFAESIKNPRFRSYSDKIKMKRVKFDDPGEGKSSEKEVKKVKKHTLDSDEEDSSDDEATKQ